MNSVTSVSGGKTSAFMAEKYPTDYNVFALVRIEDQRCRFKDEIIRKRVEDRIQAPFIATAEDDMIIYTMFDLEQYLGREIKWVTGITFDEVIRYKGGWLPNKLHRYCTHHLKIEPIFYWWAEVIGEPCVFNIGYRANEKKRVLKMQDKLNDNDLLEFKATFEKNKRGQNKWETVEWQKPCYPLYDNGIYHDRIQDHWLGKKVRFAELNNCVGCHHRHPILLRKMFDVHPPKMCWFKDKEGYDENGKFKNYWKDGLTYEQIEKSELQFELSFDDFGECDSGYCEMD